MGPWPQVFSHPGIWEQLAKEAQQQPTTPQRPFESGRTMPRNEGLERAIKLTEKGGG